VVALLDHLHAHVDHVEVTALLDGTFHAELALQGPAGERRIDSRPSDAIALALRVDAPVFASEDVLDEAGTIPSVVTDADAVDEEAIEAEVARFRTLLDDLEPDQLADGDPDDPPDASQG
jgi:bifunctional DNase/RNase